ncbi:hypothetical protein [Brumimicrobium mesophilum]|uniref:hypothetical protein n=1 Tax=Brumimicrobium mesophilum TaxID=392717 RepID=UPI000D144E58|nr:hypothetical protein [Brumimicrobium mesophilum]
MVIQNPVSLQIPLIQSHVDKVTEVLHQGGKGNPCLEEGVFPFQKLESVHFGRWIIIPAKGSLPASLFYAANIDGTAENHLNEIVTNIPEGLDKILEHCPDYPVGDARNKTSRLNYLKKYEIKTQGFYTGAPNRTVKQVHQEAALHQAIKSYIKDNKGRWKNAKDAFSAIKERFKNDKQWDWAKERYELPKVNIPATILFVLLMLILLPFILFAILMIRLFYEPREHPKKLSQNQIPKEKLKALKNQEDIIYQNQLSQVFDTKTGLRRIMLRFLLWSTTKASRYIFVKGQLFGTPTIHFARWVLVDNGKRFIFFSNFDGSFDEYLGDFVDNNGWGLNLIYGAAKGYPKTYFMIGGGSYKILEFMGWGRNTQVPSHIWYSAYPWYGQQQIVSKTILRTEIFNSKTLNEKEARNILKDI